MAFVLMLTYCRWSSDKENCHHHLPEDKADYSRSVQKQNIVGFRNAIEGSESILFLLQQGANCGVLAINNPGRASVLGRGDATVVSNVFLVCTYM